MNTQNGTKKFTFTRHADGTVRAHRHDDAVHTELQAWMEFTKTLAVENKATKQRLGASDRVMAHQYRLV